MAYFYNNHIIPRETKLKIVLTSSEHLSSLTWKLEKKVKAKFDHLCFDRLEDTESLKL